jgi:hypothetical protein
MLGAARALAAAHAAAVHDNLLMRIADVSQTERAVVEAFGTGTAVDVRDRPDRVVRGELIRFLLLGGIAVESGDLPALSLTGAHITGALELEHAEVIVPVRLHECRFDERMSVFGSQLRRLSLDRSVMPGLMAAMATFDASLGLTGCRSTGVISLVGARIGGALFLNGAALAGPVTALNGTWLRVGTDVLARDGFTCRGALLFDNAEIGGSLRWEGAVLNNPAGVALSGQDLRVGANADLCDGLSANGAVRLRYAQVGSRLCFERARFAVPAGKTALDCRHVVARELVLLPAGQPGGVDLSHARIGLLRDSSATWPSVLRLNGLTYEAMFELDSGADRVRWLRLDPDGFRPQAYAQLAQVYRSVGRDDDARTVLLAGERHRRDSLARPGRWWGRLQDLSVGYGYRPVRAAGWLAALLVVGTVLFQLYPPQAVERGKAPDFVAPIYTLDLILPVIDFGQQSAYHPRGASVWLAYALMAAGLLLMTTIAAAGARQLRRD